MSVGCGGTAHVSENNWLWFLEKFLGYSGLVWLNEVEVCSDFEKSLEVPLGGS